MKLADPAGPVLRVEETYVADQIDTPKSERSQRTLALGPVVAEALAERLGDTSYQHESDRVFCHPQTGGPFPRKRYAETFRAAR